MIRRLVYIFIALALAAALGATAAVWLMLQHEATIRGYHPAGSGRGNQLELVELGQITSDFVLLMEISEAELSQIVEQQVAQAVGVSGVRCDIRTMPGMANVRLSAALPLGFKRRYLNIAGQLTVGDAPEDIDISELRIGALSIPSWLRSALTPLAIGKCRQNINCDAALAAYKNVTHIELGSGGLQLQYALAPEGLRGTDRDLAGEVERLTPYVQELTAMALEQRDGYISLHSALRRVFSLAQRQSVLSNDAVAENRSALLALAALGADKRVLDLLDIGAVYNQFQEAGSVHLRGRKDLARHFLTSAALYLLGGVELSEYLGIYKELDDVGKGKPFGVGDLAANRIGIRVAKQATDSHSSALRLQSRIITSSSADSYLIADNILSDLQEHYQAARDIDVLELTNRIDSLLAELPLLQP